MAVAAPTVAPRRLRCVAHHLIHSCRRSTNSGGGGGTDPASTQFPSAPAPVLVPTRARHQLEEEGWAVVDGICGPDMLSTLRDAARRVVALARGHPDAHDLCGGFTSRDRPGEEPWSIRGLFAPGWGAPCFAQYMASKPVLRLVRELLGCGPGELMLPDADCILFTDVPGRDRAQAWHRDMRWAGEGGDYTEAAQRVRWAAIQAAAGGWLEQQAGDGAGRSHRGSPCGHNGYFEEHGGAYLRWQLALTDTVGCGIELVPRSHRRFRTDFEDDCLLPAAAKQVGVGVRCGGTPQAMSGSRPGGGGADSGVSLMPRARFVDLRAGQALLWSGDLLHRGRTPVSAGERLTLSCSWSRWNGVHAAPPDYRDRTVAWKLVPAVRAALPTPWMRLAWDRWRATQNTTSDRWVGPNPAFRERRDGQGMRLSGLGREGGMEGGVGDGVTSAPAGALVGPSRDGPDGRDVL